ncbi:MAG: gfo/Idh/MocA family oxidoreductase [Puniceicoccaceae bacterium]|nr:MAG: gfo/Idh/MocA family oxidoreductase [Puniceicoccaceae bacterium]
MGMVGGGPGAFIGAVHRMAAALDGQIELVAGAFSSDPKKSEAAGEELFIAPDRCYGSFHEMAKAEAARDPDDRIDFVSIVTPNHLHFAVAKTFLQAGFHVVCDKPATFDLKEAKALRKIVKATGKVFALTHNYSGYALVKEARHLVQSGKLGKILKVVAEYPQGWLLDAIEKTDQKQAAWRTDPARAGASCCVGDIGTHAEHLARYITGLEIESLCAEFTTFVPGRQLEDDANILVRYKGGAKGIIYASQISAGEENGPHVRIYGTKGSLEWHQPEPNQLILKFPDQPSQTLRPGNPYLSKRTQSLCRLPAGHPEAFLEAFANIYKEAVRAMREAVKGKQKANKAYDFPTIDDGVYGMAFIETTVRSASSKQKWTKFPSL